MGMGAFLGRTTADILSGGTLGITPEIRNIVLAQGIQFTNADQASDPFSVLPKGLTEPASGRASWPPCMRTRAPLAITTTASGFEYTDLVQGVKFVVKIVTAKDAFRAALLTPGVHVVYDGHARYGRGPCFGILPVPGTVSVTEDWEEGTNPSTTGIFRMGYPFIGVPMEEVLTHGYTCNLVEDTVTVNVADCDPDTRPYVSALHAKHAVDIDSRLPAQAKDKSAAKRWWAYRAWEDGRTQWHVLLKAGWTGTTSAPFDLGATTPTCRVFCHFGCETFRHNHPILRGAGFKNWRKSGDDKFAYFTTNLSSGPTVTCWLYHLFTYPKRNSFHEWEPSLTHALNETNKDLSHNGETFRLI
jgi:hypothetical protein